jgi:uncharacterized protein (TIGR03437 family)
MKRLQLLLLAGALAATPLWPYTFFLHYGSKGQVIPERFDLNQLPLNTVTFYVSDAGPTVYDGNDSFPSVVNQIRHAAQVWNGVSTSSLRVAFGGLFTIGTQDNSPGGEVVFEEMPPGVLAFSGPTTCEAPGSSGNAACTAQIPANSAPFLPIMRSTMHMSQDLSIIPGPGVAETLFLLSVHEMGHALGLQHTYTSSAMSTIATRATSLANPIEDDDRVGLSLLYPANKFPSQMGSITGTVTYSGSNAPVHMASVVAIRYGAPAISALTLPDGTFEIDGLPTGQYFLYAHPLPPPLSADIRSPLDSNGNSVDPTQPFDAVVYPGVLSLLKASTVAVTAGQVTSGMNFSVTPRADIPIFDVEMYSYFYPTSETFIGVHPAFISEQPSPGLVVAHGNGLGSNGNATNGLNVQVMGGTAAVQSLSAYVDSNLGDTDLAVDLSFSNFGAVGMQHVLFATSDYLYILPAAFTVVRSQPPTISSVAASDDGSLAIAGANFAAGMNVYFDALPGTVNNLDLVNQIATVVPPEGASGQIATLAAYNADGQSSMFLQGLSPVEFTYATLPSASLTILPGNLPAANEAKVDIEGTNTNFVQGRTAIGFGTHDVVVRNTFVLSPTHVVVDVSIPEGAAQITTPVTALTDFQLIEDTPAFQIQAPQAGLPAAVPILFNAVPTESGSFVGALVTIYGLNLTDANNDTPTVTFNGISAPLVYVSATQLNLTIPSGLGSGLATLLVNNTQQTSFPTIVNIAPPQPVITVINLAGQAIANSTAISSGQAVDVLLTGLTNPGALSPGDIQVSVGGVSLPALSITQVGSSNVYDVQFDLSAAVPLGSETLIVYVNGESSTTATLTVGAGSSSSSGS